jgi:TonB family protein
MTVELLRIPFIRSLCLLALISVLPSLPVLAQTANTSAPTPQSQAVWEAYTVTGDGFSVQLPIFPAMSTSDYFVVKLNTHRRERILGAYADGVVYAIYTYENPNGRQSLDELIGEFSQPATGSLKRELVLNGMSGKEYAFRDDDRSGVTQFYITDDRFYVFEAVGSSVGHPDIGVPRFLSSIRLERNPRGKEIVNGPGAQPAGDAITVPSGNDGRVLPGKEVTRKASVITKPQPTYTEEARRNQISGTVILRCVFSSSGAVTNIIAVSKLPDGLTEKAIAAAKQIRFIPAQKDGRFVSMYIQLEYNFNLY